MSYRKGELTKAGINSGWPHQIARLASLGTMMQADDGGKDPWLIQMPGGAPYAFAGFWAHNTRREPAVTSCTIITAPSIAPVSQIHDRMPIILDPSVFDAWLNPTTPVENLKGTLSHHVDGQMQMHRVGREINSSRFTERPALIVNSL